MTQSPTMHSRSVLFWAVLASVMISAIRANSQPPEIKEYTPTVSRQLFYTVSFDKSMLRITVPAPSGEQAVQVERNTIATGGGKVTAAAMVLFDARGMLFHDSVYPYDAISDIEVSRDDHETAVRFYTSARPRSTISGIHRGNRVTFDQDVEVAKDDFVRGVIFSVIGNIRVAGETNKDVVSLFGDITVAPQAVVRGNLVSITGAITVAKTSTIYGDTYSGTRRSWIHRHRMYRGEEVVDVIPRISYNRVDGFAPYLTVRYQSHDSTLPVGWATVGYGFASTHLRYEFGVEQRLCQPMALTFGGRYGRTLASSDDRLIGDGENTGFALLVTEDFKDFYESQGGAAYLKAVPAKGTAVQLAFGGEETGWLNAHRNLWSLFGGNKRFPENFATVPPAVRSAGIAEIDTTTNIFFSMRAEYNGTYKDSLFSRSTWRAWGTLEWSARSIGSDFSYRRYVAQVRRYQRATRQSMLLLTGTCGASDGRLPMNRLFFLGGPGTLYGYKNKEYWGSRFWMTNAEYRLTIPRRDVAFSLFWESGQISSAARFTADSEVKHSLGVAMYIGRGFRFSVARRLDRSTDNRPEIYVRLADIY